MTPRVQVAAPARGREVLARLVAVILLLTYGAAVAPPPDVPWHGPDAHSNLPHRAPSLSASAGFALARTVNEAPAVSPALEGMSLLASASPHPPGTLAPEPPEHPPRT